MGDNKALLDRAPEIIKALRCDGYGIGEESALGCTNKKCAYRDVDGACDIVSMDADAAALIEAQATQLSAVTAERDVARRVLWFSIETHTVDPRQIERLERYYLKQARDPQGAGEGRI